MYLGSNILVLPVSMSPAPSHQRCIYIPTVKELPYLVSFLIGRWYPVMSPTQQPMFVVLKHCIFLPWYLWTAALRFEPISDVHGTWGKRHANINAAVRKKTGKTCKKFVWYGFTFQAWHFHIETPAVMQRGGWMFFRPDVAARILKFNKNQFSTFLFQ